MIFACLAIRWRAECNGTQVSRDHWNVLATGFAIWVTLALTKALGESAVLLRWCRLGREHDLLFVAVAIFLTSE